MKGLLGVFLLFILLGVFLLIAGHADYLAACQSAGCYR